MLVFAAREHVVHHILPEIHEKFKIHSSLVPLEILFDPVGHSPNVYCYRQAIIWEFEKLDDITQVY